MDGKGRAIDNIFIERFWRNIKYEKIYLEPSDNGLDLYCKIKEYMTNIIQEGPISDWNIKGRSISIGRPLEFV
jgi:putative transposase